MGVRLFNLDKKAELVAVECVPAQDEEDEMGEDEHSEDTTESTAPEATEESASEDTPTEEPGEVAEDADGTDDE